MKAEARKTAAVRHPGVRYTLAADHDQHDIAVSIADTYLDTIVDAIVNQPRSLQRRIGPSEMGVECNRAILHKLNGDEEPRDARPPWKPTIGTAVHTYLEEAFEKASQPGQEQEGRWLTEKRVTVGEVGGVKITGSTDLFDTWTGTVMDHKITGKSTTQKYRAHGPSRQYYIQAMLYGKGWKAAGYDVRMVAICFLPREGELSGDSFIWTAPYDEQAALDALARLNGLSALLKAAGIEQALTLYGECDDRWCRWCSSGSSFGKRPMATSTKGLLGM